ncbi:MAG: HAMP domain-containing histidine kinase [Elusimicrobia bacterium]|nr:HAMP domain-containing histidine kinase [Elusimicrobiota bacterium]
MANSMAERDRTERMANVIAHEIRNPLAVINNSIYFVKTKLGSGAEAKVAKHIGIIEGEVKRANEMIGEMLAYARPLEAQAKPVAVRELIDSAVALRPAPAKVKTAVSAPKDARVLADPEAARLALRKLLDNALDAVGESGSISIQAQAAAGSVELLVRDSGPGVSAEAAARLFEPFSSTKPRGLGLGLATARKFAERLGGSVELVERGPGAVFRLRLPSV